MRHWSPRRWLAALAATAVFVVLLGLPTTLIPNPIFARPIEAPWWSYPVWLTAAVLAGLLAATYVRNVRAASAAEQNSDTTQGQRSGIGGGLLALFAVGCPTCNVLVVMALGTSGALAWFEPVQPVLAVGALMLLAWALRARLRSEQSCRIPAAMASSQT